MAVQTIATLKANMPVGAAGGTTVQDIHDIVDTLESLTTQAVVTKTAGYTAVLTDNRMRVVFDSATAVTFTLPSSLPVGWECSILQKGAGQVQVQATGGALLSRENHTRTAGPGSQAYMWVYANAGTSPQVAFSGDTST